jgi:hypothetical protein
MKRSIIGGCFAVAFLALMLAPMTNVWGDGADHTTGIDCGYLDSGGVVHNTAQFHPPLFPGKDVTTPSGNVNLTCHFQGPAGTNTTGKAVHWDYAATVAAGFHNPYFNNHPPRGGTQPALGIPCALKSPIGDSYGYVYTLDWEETISASGEVNISCHFHH